jgi:hypothetical protein
LKATSSSSWRTMDAGVSPFAILQKRQSLIPLTVDC